MNLLPAIAEIKVQIREIKARHNKELAPYEDSLRALQNLNDACEICSGTGEVFRRACAEDEGDYYKCLNCKGTGKIITAN